MVDVSWHVSRGISRGAQICLGHRGYQKKVVEIWVRLDKEGGVGVLLFEWRNALVNESWFCYIVGLAHLVELPILLRYALSDSPKKSANLCEYSSFDSGMPSFIGIVLLCLLWDGVLLMYNKGRC